MWQQMLEVLLFFLCCVEPKQKVSNHEVALSLAVSKISQQQEIKATILIAVIFSPQLLQAWLNVTVTVGVPPPLMEVTWAL